MLGFWSWVGVVEVIVDMGDVGGGGGGFVRLYFEGLFEVCKVKVILFWGRVEMVLFIIRVVCF